MSSVSKENVKLHCGAEYIAVASVAFVLTVVSVILYNYVPVSDIANGIEHSAKDGLIFLAFSPVCVLVAAIAYIIGGVNEKAIVKNSVVQLVIFIVSSVLLLFIFLTSVAMFFEQLSLGFVAPLTDTVWEKLGTVNIFAAVLYTVGNVYLLVTARK